MSLRFLSTSALCVCLLSGAAYAQNAQQMDSQQMNSQMQGAQARMFDALHGALNLTPAQEDGWGMFERAYAIDPGEMARRRDAAATMSTLNAPQRVDQSIGLMKGELDSLRRRGAALKTFYATLSSQQQSVFDRQTLSPQRTHG